MWQSGLRRGVLPWVMGADAIITQISTPCGGAYRSGVRGVRCDALQQKGAVSLVTSGRCQAMTISTPALCSISTW